MRAGIPVLSVHFDNTVLCRPTLNNLTGKGSKNRTPSKTETETCSQFLLYKILRLRPKLILTTGKVPQGAVEKLRASFPPDYIPMIRAVYHPAYILRKQNLRGEWERAIRGIIEELVTTPSGGPQDEGNELAACRNGLSPSPDAEVGTISGMVYVDQTGDIDWSADILGVDTEYDTDDKGDTEDEQSYVLVQVSDGEQGMAWRREYAVEPIARLAASKSPHTTAYAHVRADLPRLGLSWDTNWEDVLLAAYVLRLPVGLKPLAMRLLGVPMRTYIDLVTWEGKKHKFSDALDYRFQEAWDYAVNDAVVTARCWKIVRDLLEAEPKLKNCYYEFERPLVPVLHKMERNGVLVDADVLSGLQTELEERIDRIKLSSVKDFGIENIASTQQVAEWLVQTGWEPTKYTETGLIATDEAVLAEILEYGNPDDHVMAFIEAVLEQRGLTKFNSTYVKRLLRDRDLESRVHTQYHQTVADTGRLSSSKPNLQNIPVRDEMGKKLRRAFKARPGYVWLRGDFSQVEVRLFAHFTQEPVLIKAYNTPGADVHQGVADALGIDRKPAKNTLFCIIYGGGADKAAVTAGVPANRAGSFLDRIKREMPSLLAWPRLIEVMLENNGFVETQWGFRNYYPMFWSPLNRDRAEALRQAGNQPIQGTAAQVMKRWMIRMQEVFDRYDCAAVIQVHDELGVECPIGAVKYVAPLMESIGAECGLPEITVPLIVEVSGGPNWVDQQDWRELAA